MKNLKTKLAIFDAVIEQQDEKPKISLREDKIAYLRSETTTKFSEQNSARKTKS